MKVKRFLAPDMRQVLNQVREEFGADAVILSHEKKGNGIELLAGCEPGMLKSSIRSASKPSGAEWYTDPALEQMKEELSSIKDLLCDRLSDLLYKEKKRLHPLQTLVLSRLSEWGFSPEIARKLLAAIPKTESLLSALRHIQAALREQIACVVPLEQLNAPALTIFHGQAGAGKTSALLKMAMQLFMKKPGISLGFLTTQDERVAGFDPLLHYAKILDFPVHIIQSLDSAIDASDIFSTADYVFLDMPSFASEKDPFWPERLEWAQAVRARYSGDVYTYLVLDSKNDWLSLQNTVDLYRVAGVDACVLSKLDETARMGPVCSALLHADLPVAFCSVSKKIPDGFLPWNPVWINQRFFSGGVLAGAGMSEGDLEESISDIDSMDIVSSEVVC